MSYWLYIVNGEFSLLKEDPVYLSIFFVDLEQSSRLKSILDTYNFNLLKCIQVLYFNVLLRYFNEYCISNSSYFILPLHSTYFLT